MQVPNAGPSNSAMDDLPVAELDAIRQMPELKAPELQDRNSIQVAIETPQHSEIIEEEQINPLEQKVKKLEAEKEELVNRLAAMQNNSAVSLELEDLADSNKPHSFLDLDLPGPSRAASMSMWAESFLKEDFPS